MSRYLPAGEYQLDLLEEETGAGTVDIMVNGVLEQRGQAPGGES